MDENSVLILANTRHPLAMPKNDRGRVAPGLSMERILLQLNSSPEQQAALDQLLEDQQDPSSPNYQNWLTPEQFGEKVRRDVDRMLSSRLLGIRYPSDDSNDTLDPAALI